MASDPAKKSGKIQVLLIEDVEPMRLLLEETLSKIEEVSVSGMAKNSWEARLELHRRRPDLVVLDEIIPGESSLDLLTEFAGQGIPVILISGTTGDEEGGARPLPPGAFSRLAKPGWETLEEDRRRYRSEILKASGPKRS